MAIIINNHRFTHKNHLPELIAALLQLPSPGIDDTQSIDLEKSVTLLQRENGCIDPEKTGTRYVGTERLADCLFVIFTIQDNSQKKRYFASHVDSNTHYNWEARFKTFAGCRISATLIGAISSVQKAKTNLEQLLTYLLDLSEKCNIDLTLETQCLQDHFRPTLTEWPLDFTLRLQNKAQTLHQRLFKQALPPELKACRFDEGLQTKAAENTKIAKLLIKLQKNTNDDSVLKALKTELLIEGTLISWVDFVNFILDGDAIIDSMVQTLTQNAKYLAPSPAKFAELYKQLFTSNGFNAVHVAFMAMEALPSIKANNLFVDLVTGRMIPVPQNWLEGKFYLPRKLKIIDYHAPEYWEAYNSEEGYRYPNLSCNTRTCFVEQVTPLLRDVSQGIPIATVDKIVRTIHGSQIGLRELGINLTLNLCWLAHRWANSPEALLCPPQTPVSRTVQNHILYLNKITGVKFQGEGVSNAVYTGQNNPELQAIHAKLKDFGIDSELSDDHQLRVLDITRYTRSLKQAVDTLQTKQTKGFAFSF